MDDSALAGGVDKSIVYRRKTKEILRSDYMLRKNFFPELTNNKWYGEEYIYHKTEFYTKGRTYEYNIKVFVIGFCGKVYKGVRLQLGRGYQTIDYKPTYHYNKETLLKEMKKVGIVDTSKVPKINYTPVDCNQMIEDKIMSVDFENAKKDVLNLLKDPASLRLWSSSYFKDVCQRINVK